MEFIPPPQGSAPSEQSTGHPNPPTNTDDTKPADKSQAALNSLATAQPDAWQRYKNGQLAEVVKLCSKSDSADSLQLLGLALHDLGRPLEAADAFEKASLLCPVQDEVRIALASCYAQLRRIDLARELYLQLALSRRLSPTLMLQVAAGLEAIDAPQLAMQVCEWITEQDEHVAQAYYDMGYYSARSGQPLYMTEALTCRALQLDPANVHYRIGLVSLLIQLDREDEAAQAMQPLSVLDIRRVTCVSCLTRIATVLARKDMSQLAEACVTRADLLRQSKEATSNNSTGSSNPIDTEGKR
ncbi:tetratricopeptide repeat protein [Neorhodopirellula lusitana]|uniref:tetratricopeptide repeat protein n=1 Tax=Neorhodopirellula lusitana TaxID=445327 RepID=UPI00384FC954